MRPMERNANELPMRMKSNTETDDARRPMPNTANDDPVRMEDLNANELPK